MTSLKLTYDIMDLYPDRYLRRKEVSTGSQNVVLLLVVRGSDERVGLLFINTVRTYESQWGDGKYLT